MNSDGKRLVLEATDIVELVGQTVRLRRSGRNWVGLCPFHQEKSGSFYVYTETQSYYCFGCKKSGNAIDFVIERDHLDFKGSLNFLADKAGIALPKFGGRGGDDSSDRNERAELLEANSLAAMLFEKWLEHAEIGTAAREYLESRGFTDETIRRFRVGVTRESWDSLLVDSSMKKFGPQLLHRAGLLKERDPEKGQGYYDTFRNRLMFPIRDEAGRVIAFGGRVMPGSDDKAKYLNSPETPLFHKSRCIYGIDLARQKIVETRTVAVVEGYTDVMMAHQFGCTNVVSVLGTALTADHVSILKRYADKIVLVFDPDEAGDVAVNRALELFLSAEVEVAVATIPGDRDPDEFLLADGAAAWDALVTGASDALVFKWKQLAKRYAGSDDITGRQKAVREYLDLIASARGQGPIDTIRWGEILVRISRLTEIPVDQLNREFGGSGRRLSRNRPVTGRDEYESRGEVHDGEDDLPKDSVPEYEEIEPSGPVQQAEAWVLGVLLRRPDDWHDVSESMQPGDFSTATHRRLAEFIWQRMRDEGELVFNEMLGELVDARTKTLAMELYIRLETVPDLKLTLKEGLAAIHNGKLRREEHQTLAAIRAGGKSIEGVDLLARAQEQARRPDLRRSGS